MEQDMDEKQKYKDWCDLLKINKGIIIINNNGFRDIKDFNEDMVFTRREFNIRLLTCTVISVISV